MGRLLTPEDFIYCKGVAISGHIHKSGCFNGFYYYCGCPYRWKFGEEEDKGFLLLVHDLDSQIHYVEFESIPSDKYITLFLDELVSEDPQKIINHIDNMKAESGADYVKIKVRTQMDGSSKSIINQYYRNIPTVNVEFLSQVEAKKQKMEESIHDSYNYLVDPVISDLERFVMYVNEKEGEQFITTEELKRLLKSDI
jgi:DNA repair exonuclease SbcCD nuclease subunit